LTNPLHSQELGDILSFGLWMNKQGYKVAMKPAKAGNAAVDGVAVSPEQEQIAIEVKSPHDDLVRGIGQCYEAICFGYARSILVTTLRVARGVRKSAFEGSGITLIGIDSKANVHRYDSDGRRLLG
jgi:hypothetical protein